MHLGVLERHGRLARHAGQHFQVFVREAALLVHRVDLDHAQRLAFGADHRSADHRADREVGDALGHAETFVARCVGREDRLARCHCLFDDGAADPRALFVAFAAILHRHRHQRPVRLRPHHDEAAVGLDENLEQAIEQLRQDFVHAHRLAEIVGDLQERCELDLRLGREPPAGRSAAAHVERGHHAGPR